MPHIGTVQRYRLTDSSQLAGKCARDETLICDTGQFMSFVCLMFVKWGGGAGGGVQDMLWRNVNLDITSTDGYLSWPKHVAAITIPARSGHISVITNSTANSEQYQQRNVCHCAQVQELQLHRLQPLSKHITSSNCTILY